MTTGEEPGSEIVDAEFTETQSKGSSKPARRRVTTPRTPTLLEVLRDLSDKHPEVVKVLAEDLAERRKGDRDDKRNSKILVGFIAACGFGVAAHLGGYPAVGIVSAMMTGMFGVSENGRAVGRAIKQRWMSQDHDDIDDDPDPPALTA